MLYLKYTLTITIFILCLLIALNTYRLYVFVNKHTFLFVFKNFKINLKKLNIKLSSNQFFNHRISFKEIVSTDHKYFFYLITPPVIAIYIRSVYSEFHQFDYGIFMLITFILLIIGLYLYFMYKHLQFLKNYIKQFPNEILEKSTKSLLNESELQQLRFIIEKDCSTFNRNEQVLILEY